MKRVFIISLLAVMLLQAFSKVFIVVDYQANKAYIMEFLCINRDKPQLQCEGQCYLKKKLKEQEQAEKQSEERSQKQEVQINLYCQALFGFNYLNTDNLSAPYTGYRPGHAANALQAVFHPPQLIIV